MAQGGVSEVQRILKAKNFFEVLELSLPEVTTEDVRKAHKRLVLKVHPDKCSEPGAEEAFGEVTKAVELLSDEAVLERFIELFRNKEKREAFEKDPANVQKQEAERKRRRDAGEVLLDETSVSAQATKHQKVDELEKKLSEHRQQMMERLDKQEEEKLKKVENIIEEKTLSHTRKSWQDFMRCGKTKRGKMPKVRREGED
eukprot:RCo011365